MRQVIYADVLVIINMFVTYGIMRLTGIICRSEKRQLLLFVASLFSGLYSLIIIIPDISDMLVAFSRLPVGIILVAMCFKIYNLRHFLRLFACFFTVNFLFAGLMFALWYLFAPKGMYFNNGIVYFNISIKELVILICVCYFSVLLINKLISFRTPVNTVYELYITYEKRTVSCRAFLDTGNSLKEPFTGYPIIVLNKEIAQRLFDFEISMKPMNNGNPVFCPVFCSTVSGTDMLISFRPDSIRVKGISCDFESDKVCIAVTDSSIKNGDYCALLSSEIFENKTYEKGDYYLASVFKKSYGNAEVDNKR